jgi:coniferyl-aldehyde dehydrogenase
MAQPAPAFQPTKAVQAANPEALSNMRGLFDRARAAFRREPYPDLHQRMQRLQKLLDLVRQHQDRIAQTISHDFGGRSVHETQLAEIYTLVSSIKYIRKHLHSWMKPQPREVGLQLRPAGARVQHQPLGVVGVISPWNYPVNLALGPMVYALAAGNRVLLKPSELTPKTSELLQELLAQAFDSNLVSVITGGPDVGQAFSELPFDHLLYTGSTRVGRLVMQAAAKNLTPVTLELGGKSPAIVHQSYSLDKAARRIAAGKWFNAGQTCIAPDYVLVPESRREAFIYVLKAAVSRSYPSLVNNPDYTSIINRDHWQRLRAYVDDAVARGAEAIEINPKGETFTIETRKFPPTLLLNVSDDMTVMQEEIFGPVLPIVSYLDLEAALRFVNDRPHPLALYYFDTDPERIDQVLDHTLAGGVCINETNYHFAIDDLPFGGVGPSGMGRYHGPEGFETFSSKKSVFVQSRWSRSALIAPPYGRGVEKLSKFFINH